MNLNSPTLNYSYTTAQWIKLNDRLMEELTNDSIENERF